MTNILKLSKSKYCNGVYCPKILWLDKHCPEQKAAMDQQRLINGNKVGDLAMGYFGDFTEVPFDRSDVTGMIQETERLLKTNTAVIAEASFGFGNNFCSVDLLRKVTGGYEMIEVKSTSAQEDKSSIENYIDDLSYQYYVVSNYGLVITKISLLEINKDYVRKGSLNLKEYFVLNDCTQKVLDAQADLPKNITAIEAVFNLATEPDIKLASRCGECLYKIYCFRDLPKPNVFDIGFRMHGSKKDEIYDNGYVSFKEVLNAVLDGKATLKDQPLLQVKSYVDNLPPTIILKKIDKFLATLKYPLYHLDFETFQQVIPQWDGIKPYRQIPFQYSIHIQDEALAKPTHKEFLATEGVDTRRALAESLCRDIPKDVDVLAYYASFEKTRLKELAEEFPDLSSHLLNIMNNTKDLIIPFTTGAYYTKEMGGSCSIKNVLPALCPTFSDSYHDLKLIHNGSEAMNIYADLHEKNPAEIAEIRLALLEYCKLDTLAMVNILEKLYSVVK